jgi:hypothetical protein
MVQSLTELKRIRSKKQPLSFAGLHVLWDEYRHSIHPRSVKYKRAREEPNSYQ